MYKSTLKTDLKLIKSMQKKPDGIFGSFMTRPVSHVFAYIFYRFNLSPNAVSFASFVLSVISCTILLMNQTYVCFIFAACIWWLGAILDAADGDLARYAGKSSYFGGWFDSLLDRMKEMLIFSVLTYLMIIQHDNMMYYIIGMIALASGILSGYITDTKKLFIQERKPAVSVGRKYILGMVDTRDFLVIFSLFVYDIRIVIIISAFFMTGVIYQAFGFYKRYGMR